MYPFERFPGPTIPPARPLDFGLVVLIMLWHLYHTAPLLQNFHDLSGKVNNMSLDHGRGAMLNRPPGPGGSYPPQVASKQFPQPTRFVPSTHTPTNPLQHLPPNEYEKWPYRKIIRYLWFKVHHSTVWLFIASQLWKIKSSNKFPFTASQQWIPKTATAPYRLSGE